MRFIFIDNVMGDGMARLNLCEKCTACHKKLTASPYSVRAGMDLGTSLNQPGPGRATGRLDLTYTERVAVALERSLIITVHPYTGNDRYGKTASHLQQMRRRSSTMSCRCQMLTSSSDS